MADAVLLLDKPSGISSFRAVRAVARLFGVKKAGHAGTLDPMATGLLVVCMGRATKLSRFIMEGAKEYEGRMLLGVATDTYDAEGRITEENHIPAGLDLNTVRKEASLLTGRILQSPPPFSAVKHKGVPMYKLARKGELVRKEPRPVSVSGFAVEDAGFPELRFRITCSRGTYIRSLVHELGQRLGTGAHMTALRRTRCGDLDVDRAFTLDDLSMLAESGNLEACLMDVTDALSHIPSIVIEQDDALALRQGRGMEISRLACGQDMASCSGSSSGLPGSNRQSGPFVKLVMPREGREELVAVARPPWHGVRGGRLVTEKIWQ